jgi:hypothetical protein
MAWGSRSIGGSNAGSLSAALLCRRASRPLSHRRGVSTTGRAALVTAILCFVRRSIISMMMMITVITIIAAIIMMMAVTVTVTVMMHDDDCDFTVMTVTVIMTLIDCRRVSSLPSGLRGSALAYRMANTRWRSYRSL